jgi:3-isopropylmalate/(R)-2-methylmalate dehydratase large subunit
MKSRTFAEKIFGAQSGDIVFRQPDIILTHDNTSSIISTFKKMGGQKLFKPDQLLIVLDHNAPPTNSKLANDYQQIRNFVTDQGIRKAPGEIRTARDDHCRQRQSYRYGRGI